MATLNLETNVTAVAPLTRTKRHILERKAVKAARRLKHCTGRPPYTVPKPLADGTIAYYFNPPPWARKPGCPVGHEELGTDMRAAYERAWMLGRQLLSWKTKGKSDIVPDGKPEGLVDWLCFTFQKSFQFGRLAGNTKRGHIGRMNRFCDFVLPDGTRIGDAPLEEIDSAFMDMLREHLTVRWFGEGANRRVEFVKSTEFNHMVKVLHRAFAVVKIRKGHIMPKENPFSKLGLNWIHQANVKATWKETITFVEAADMLAIRKGDFKYFGVGTLALMLFELLQRPQHACRSQLLEHYRPDRFPNHILVQHPKSGSQVEVPLFRANGELAHPELAPRLEEHVRQAHAAGRATGLLIVRAQHDPATGREVPWINERFDGSALYAAVRDVIEFAELNPELSLSSFRHGGFTECGDADFTDTEIRVLSRHRTPVHMPTYVGPTQRQLLNGIEKRHVVRPAPGDDGVWVEPERIPIPAWSELHPSS